MKINKCKKCDSTNVEFVVNYEHLGENDIFIEDDGYLCKDCECFMLLNGDYEYYGSSTFDGTNVTKVNQLIQ